MKIELQVGEAVVVTFVGTDGEITISFSDAINSLTGCSVETAKSILANGHGITIHTDLPDQSGREGIIYHEPFGYIDERIAPEISLCGRCGANHIPDPGDGSECKKAWRK